MKAVILAGGKGTRLKPYTTTIPKSLVPVGEHAIIDLLLRRLKKAGVTEVIFCVNHLAELIRTFVNDGSHWGLKARYSYEEKPLSTIAPLKLIKNLPENFLVMNGDLLTDLDPKKFFEYHLKHGAYLTVATYERTLKSDFGEIGIDKKRNLAVSFAEKPVQKISVSMGINALNRQVLKFVPKNQPFGFDNLMLTLIEKKLAIKVYPHKNYWLDIGRPEDYDQANLDIQKPALKKVFF